MITNLNFSKMATQVYTFLFVFGIITFANAAMIPGPPTITSMTVEDTYVIVSFNPPASDGGSPIVDYMVTSSQGQFATGKSSPIKVSGLVPGFTYRFFAQAGNTLGWGFYSPYSEFVTMKKLPSLPPATIPGPPTITSVVAEDTYAIVSFAPPTSDGGRPIVDYMVTSSQGQFATGKSSPIKVSGLVPGFTYRFFAQAGSEIGWGYYSPYSEFVTMKKPPPLPPGTLPGRPTITSVTAEDTYAIISFTPPASDGGRPITSYTVTSSIGGFTSHFATGPQSPLVVGGLTPGYTYRFYAQANNEIGSSAYSDYSAFVTMKPKYSVFAPANPNRVDLQISSNTANYNIFEAAMRPTTRVDVTVTIPKGVLVYSAQPYFPALMTGVGWVPGSTIKIVNRGSIVGAGGNGGEGGWRVAGLAKNPKGGQAGGDALSVEWPIVLDNSGGLSDNGLIAGGGGGGGGGIGISPELSSKFSLRVGGSGGGGGMGSLPGRGGDCGHPINNEPVSVLPPSSMFNFPNTKCGADGLFSIGTPPSGKPGDGTTIDKISFSGRGGNLGEGGMDGYILCSVLAPQDCVGGYAVGPGGRAGRAIAIYNGGSVTWVSGNNQSTVLGPQIQLLGQGPVLPKFAPVGPPAPGTVKVNCQIYKETCLSTKFPSQNAVIAVSGLTGTFDSLIVDNSIQNDKEKCFELAEQFTKKNLCKFPVLARYFGSDGTAKALALSSPVPVPKSRPIEKLIPAILQILLDDD